ncbi:MAG: hypothetical protein II826_09360 [Prevotella sp.]|nr:hypothetical protein [Prevotella sp.]
MRRIEGTSGVKLIECVNPVKGKWRIRWDVQTSEDGKVTYMEQEFQHKPSADEIRQTIIGWYNQQTTEAILSGFQYDGNMVWLSSENQYDYKAEHDLAVQTGGATLPVTFKLGTDEQPVYKTFDNLGQLTEFYRQTVLYIRETLAAGRKRKDAVDWSLYET